MATSSDFYEGDELEALFLSIDDGFLEQEEDFNADINFAVSQIEKDDIKATFSCNLCKKICKSTRGLTRHKNTMHVKQGGNYALRVRSVEEILTPHDLKLLIEKSASKVSKKNYPGDILNEVKSYQKIQLDDAVHTLLYLKELVVEFDGEAEKFLPMFYGCVSSVKNTFFRNLSRRPTILIGYELATLVLLHLTNPSVNKSDSNPLTEEITLSRRDRDIIGYISGFVFTKLHGRIRMSTLWESDICQSNLAILLAGKLDEQQKKSAEENQLIAARNRGGLWQVNSSATNIFIFAEIAFRRETVGHVRNIDSKNIVERILLKDGKVLSYFENICGQAEFQVEKEDSINLLEQMLILFVRVRSFSYAKDKIQHYKIENKRKKSRSMRTEIKKTSSSLHLGK